MEEFERNVAAATNGESSIVQSQFQNGIRSQKNANCIEIMLANLKLIRFALAMKMGNFSITYMSRFRLTTLVLDDCHLNQMAKF